jgi:pimeloyl-ACP methyl ester carboxylesterase
LNTNKLISRAEPRFNGKNASPGGLDLTIPSGSNQINAWLIPNSKDAVYADWLIIFSHGNAGNITHRQDLYQTWLDLGFNILAYDYRGYGNSTGHPSERGTYEDHKSVLKWALDNQWKKERILLLGKSLGGGVASEIARDNQVAGLILHSTFTSIPDVGAELVSLFTRPSHIKHSTQHSIQNLTSESTCPYLHSPEDTLIQFHHAQRNFQAANAPKWLYEISGDHNDSEWERRESLKTGVIHIHAILNSGQLS